MIQPQTYLNVTDNSGAKEAMCIKVLGGSKKRYARVGDVIVVAIKGAVPGGQVKDHTVRKGLVVRTVRTIQRTNGTSVSFSDNAIVILNDKMEPVGTRVFGPVAREARRDGKFQKVISLAPEVI